MFTIADVSILKERFKCRTVEITRLTKIGNKNWEVKALPLIYIRGQVWESEKLRVVRNIE